MLAEPAHRRPVGFGVVALQAQRREDRRQHVGGEWIRMDDQQSRVQLRLPTRPLRDFIPSIRNRRTGRHRRNRMMGIESR